MHIGLFHPKLNKSYNHKNMKKILLIIFVLAAVGIWIILRLGPSSANNDLKTALDHYKSAVGVSPKEFVLFSTTQQESYLRGVLDGEYILAEYSKDPNRDDFVNCLNVTFETILSGAKPFVEREGEFNYLMPWTISRLVGQSCPKETRISSNNQPEYREATTFFKLTSMSSDEVNGKQRDIIDKAFVRGALDGMVFGLYGNSAPDLVDFLECVAESGRSRSVIAFGSASTIVSCF
jgi:hypothetical protein